MIYKMNCSRYMLMRDDIKKLAKFIKEEFGIDNVYRIDGDTEQVNIDAYNNFELSVKMKDGSFIDVRNYPYGEENPNE